MWRKWTENLSLTLSRDPYQWVIFSMEKTRLKKFPWSRQQLITSKRIFQARMCMWTFFFFNSKTGFGNIIFVFASFWVGRGVYFERFMFYSFGLLSGENWKPSESMTGLSLIAWGKGESINAVYGSIFVSAKMSPTAANRVMLRSLDPKYRKNYCNKSYFLLVKSMFKVIFIYLFILLNLIYHTIIRNELQIIKET